MNIADARLIANYMGYIITPNSEDSEGVDNVLIPLEGNGRLADDVEINHGYWEIVALDGVIYLSSPLSRAGFNWDWDWLMLFLEKLDNDCHTVQVTINDVGKTCSDAIILLKD